MGCVCECMNARVHGMEVHVFVRCVCEREREIMMSKTQNVLMNQQCTPFTQTVPVAFCFAFRPQ